MVWHRSHVDRLPWVDAAARRTLLTRTGSGRVQTAGHITKIRSTRTGEQEGHTRMVKVSRIPRFG